jgi:hypothetical protein
MRQFFNRCQLAVPLHFQIVRDAGGATPVTDDFEMESHFLKPGTGTLFCRQRIAAHPAEQFTAQP